MVGNPEALSGILHMHDMNAQKRMESGLEKRLTGAHSYNIMKSSIDSVVGISAEEKGV
jgi:hypothetical protein